MELYVIRVLFRQTQVYVPHSVLLEILLLYHILVLKHQLLFLFLHLPIVNREARLSYSSLIYILFYSYKSSANIRKKLD